MPLTTQPKPAEGSAPVRGEHADRPDKPMAAPTRDNGGSDRPEHREKIDTAPARPDKNQPTAPANARGEQKVDRPIDHNDRPDKPMAAPHATESKPAPDKPGVKSEPTHENGATDRPEHREKIDAAPARSEKNQPPTPAKAGSEEKGKADHPKEAKEPRENDKEKAKPNSPEGHEKPSEKEKKEKDGERPKDISFHETRE
jgi:hypothetical protein